MSLYKSATPVKVVGWRNKEGREAGYTVVVHKSQTLAVDVHFYYEYVSAQLI
jgi:hypothetical protein